MNIFRFELKALFRSFLIWTSAITGTMLLFIWGVYPLYSGSKAELEVMLQSFPPQFVQMFGMLGDIFSFRGFYNFGFTYFGLMGAIFALTISVASFYRERRTKSQDFLFSKPATRTEIFLAKLSAVCVWVLVSNLFYMIAWVWVLPFTGIEERVDGAFLLAGLSLLFLELVFVGIGVFLSVMLKRIRSVAGLATIGGIAAFITGTLHNLVGKEELRVIAPLQYFEPFYVFKNGGYEARYVWVAVAVLILSIGSAYLKFTRADAKQV